MSAYVPSSAQVMVVLGALLASALIAGFALGRLRPVRAARAMAWLLLLGGTVGLERLSAREAPGFRMLALISFALLAMKAIVLVEDQARGSAPLPFARWLEFACGWPGMQPHLFAAPRSADLPGASTLLVRGAAHFAIGVALLGVARLSWVTLHSRLLATIFFLPGLSFFLHFGLCNMLAGGWRLRGVSCEALFRTPLRSQSLGEFWSRRWNLAFSEMTAIAVYRPLSTPLGRGPALFGAFLCSGLLHEMAISVPVRAGFGLPLLYFTIHGGLVLFERKLSKRGRPIRGWPGRVWATLSLVVPLPLLFHRPFLAGVVWPLIGIPR